MSTNTGSNRNKNIHSTQRRQATATMNTTATTSANASSSGVNHNNHITGDTNNSTKEMIQTLQSKAKDMEQRLAAAIVQQQQILSYQKNTSSTSNSGTTNNKGSTSSNKNNKNQDTLAVQQQQQQQQIIISKNINRYRMVLCETYGDWILTSPATAVQYDILNALWRSCFYGRIGPARMRIQKEQKKYDTLLLVRPPTTTTTTTTNNTSTTMVTAMAKSLQQQKESLHLFLKEGITLYEYLCHTLQHQLIQRQSSSVLHDENHTMNDDHDDDPALPSNGIVPCLYRLYIHLGDLYRYGDTNHTMSMASASYIKAMRLGPAYGHAYNQLAVIYQTKDTSTTTTTTTTASSSLSNKNQNNTITTVYWYTRSLGAAQEPFVTASSNLIRLFDSNRQWLQQQEQNLNKKILLRPGASHNNSKSNNDDNEKMPSTKVVPTNQSNTSRLCLSNFVDIQYTVFVDSMAKDNVKKNHQHHQQSDISHLQSLTNQIRTTMTSMQELLNNSSFSDSLLCKLITILAFMEYHCHIHDTSSSKSSSLSHTTNTNPTRRMTLRKLVRNIMYELGYYMAERVHRTLMNKIQQQFDKVAIGINTLNSTNTTTTTKTSATTIPSVRVLLPLLLLTEYLLHNDTDDDTNPPFGASGQQERFVKGMTDSNDSEQEKYQSAYTLYWKKIIDVYNDILSLDCICHNNHKTNKTHPQQQIEPSVTTQLQEYQELRGFLPFESFLKKRYDCRHDDDNENDKYLNDAGYLSDTATIRMMDALLDRKGTVTTNNNPHRTTQESSSSTRITSQGSFSTNISVSSSTTNNSTSNSKEAMLMKLQRFIALRTQFVSRLQRNVRVNHTSDLLVWVDDNDKNDVYQNQNYNADTTMQYNQKEFDMHQVHYNDDDDGGDCIIAMMDENEGTIQSISRLVTDENTASTTINDRSRTDDVLLMYQHNNENGGPALLVPGAMLFESSEKVPATNDPTVFQPPGMPVVPALMPNKAAMSTSFNSLFDDNACNINYSMNEAKAGPTITPPPGFSSTATGSTGNNTNLSTLLNSSYAGASVGVGMSMYGNPISNKNNDVNNWSGAAIPHSTTPPNTIGESMLLFGGPTALQTANPFAAESNDSRLFVDNTVAASTTRHYLPSYHTSNSNSDADMMFGSTTSQSPDYDALLFHSGLLKSLLMEETTTGGQQQELTKNPFAG